VRLDDPRVVRAEYANERRLAARKAAHRFAKGPDAREVAFDAIAEAAPKRYLEVGCGEGELAERVQRELGSEVVALDQSERMVELTAARGVDARVGDVQALPFEDEEFDCAVAAWMLYHVPDVERALSELARVLRPHGRLVAVTNAREHLRELAAALGTKRGQLAFDGENAEELLGQHFGRLERREAYGWLTFPSRSDAQAYVESTIVYAGRRLGELKGPLRVRRAPVVFIAHKL
jgi:ubiquinone/menaquinone biosynthesis C-methylase UbiE